MVTVDEAGGALQSPESSSFHRATAPNMLYKIRDTNLHGSEFFFFYCWCNYQKCALLNVSHTHTCTQPSGRSIKALDLMVERYAGI